MTNPLLSSDGFLYLFNQVISTKPSKISLVELVDSLYQPNQIDQTTFAGEIADGDLGKQFQYAGIVSLLLKNSWKGNIVEFCCGNGDLAKIISELEGTRVTGLDSNCTLIEKSRGQNRTNLQFEHYDLFGIKPAPKNMEGVVALHSCGNLLDRIVEVTLEDSVNKWLIGVPCCYGKINKTKKYLPRSKTLQPHSEIYGSVLKRVAFLEGYAQNAPESRQYILLELYRRLTDLDRFFYLQEAGYRCDFVRISPKTCFISGKQKTLSPANCAIVAQKI